MLTYSLHKMSFSSVLFVGVDHVLDTTLGRDLSLVESAKEFVERYQRRNEDKHALPMLASACPGLCPPILFYFNADKLRIV